MNKIYITILVFITIIGLQGCGGGESGSENETVVETETETVDIVPTSNIDITVVCTTVSPFVPTAEAIYTYHELFSGDIIIKNDISSIVQIFTPIGSNSRVCLESGDASIVRD